MQRICGVIQTFGSKLCICLFSPPPLFSRESYTPRVCRGSLRHPCAPVYTHTYTRASRVCTMRACAYTSCIATTPAVQQKCAARVHPPHAPGQTRRRHCCSTRGMCDETGASGGSVVLQGCTLFSPFVDSGFSFRSRVPFPPLPPPPHLPSRAHAAQPQVACPGRLRQGFSGAAGAADERGQCDAGDVPDAAEGQERE